MDTEQTQQEPSLHEDLAANLVTDEPQEVEAAEPEVEAETAETPEEKEVREVMEALEPPPKWDKRYKEVFEEWGATDEEGNPLFEKGRTYQERMLELYKEQQGYATKVEQERAEERKRREQYEQFAQRMNGAISPYQKFLQETGVMPDQAIRQSLGLLTALRNDPQATLIRLARESNVNLQEALSEQPWQSPESQQIEELKRQLAQMQQTDQQRQQRQAEMRMQQIQAENARQLQDFTEAKDDAGEPLHPHLDTVQETMAELIYGRENLRKQNPGLPAMGLEEAYERACKLHPDVAQAQVSKGEQERLAEKAAEAKRAKQASKRVKSGSAGKEQAEESLRDTIQRNIVAA